jgi:hypothetical protein
LIGTAENPLETSYKKEYVDEVSIFGRDLLRTIPRAGYIKLSSEEYEQAATRLRSASESHSIAVPVATAE